MFLYISIPILGLMFLISRSSFFMRKKERWIGWKIMHFWGGFFVAMFWSGLVEYSLLVISLTLIVGVLWEFYEYFYGLYKFKKTGTKKYMIKISDTAKDLILDTLGAIVWVVFLVNFL